jgi:hypothetical protein
VYPGASGAMQESSDANMATARRTMAQRQRYAKTGIDRGKGQSSGL